MSSLSGVNLTKGKPLAFDVWTHGPAGEFVGYGNQVLLAGELTAFFASRQCPGTAIRKAIDWALQQARAKHAVISGFHSPLEQSVLKVLLAAQGPVVAVLARPLQDARLPPDWAEPLRQGRMAVLSAVHTARRLTAEQAHQRNQQVAQLASQIVVAHASTAGRLSALCGQWRATGKFVTLLA